MRSRRRSSRSTRCSPSRGTRLRRHGRGRRARRRRCAGSARGRLRALPALPPSQGERDAEREHPDLFAAHAARVHRLPDLARPSRGGRRLAGLERAGDGRPAAPVRAPEVSSRLAARVSDPQARVGRAERLCAGRRRPRCDRRRALAAPVSAGAGARAGGERPSGRGRDLCDPRRDGSVGRPGARGGNPAGRRDVARVRPCSHRCNAEDFGDPSGKMGSVNALVTGGAGFIGSKLAAERYCISFSRVYHSFEAVVLRYFNVFGPRQSPHSQYAAAVPLFIAAIDQGEPVTIYGDGEQSRDFTYIANIVDATVRAAEVPGANGRIFNVAAGAPATVNHVAETIGLILGKPVEKRFEPPRPGDIRDSWGDITAARETLGYEPQVDLPTGLELTAEAIVARV